MKNIIIESAKDVIEYELYKTQTLKKLKKIAINKVKSNDELINILLKSKVLKAIITSHKKFDVNDSDRLKKILVLLKENENVLFNHLLKNQNDYNKFYTFLSICYNFYHDTIKDEKKYYGDMSIFLKNMSMGLIPVNSKIFYYPFDKNYIYDNFEMPTISDVELFLKKYTDANGENKIFKSGFLKKETIIRMVMNPNTAVWVHNLKYIMDSGDTKTISNTSEPIFKNNTSLGDKNSELYKKNIEMKNMGIRDIKNGSIDTLQKSSYKWLLDASNTRKDLIIDLKGNLSVGKDGIKLSMLNGAFSGIWKNGDVLNGYIGNNKSETIWKNGDFYNGRFEGIFERGIFYGGVYVISDNSNWNGGDWKEGHIIIKNCTYDMLKGILDHFNNTKFMDSYGSENLKSRMADAEDYAEYFKNKKINNYVYIYPERQFCFYSKTNPKVIKEFIINNYNF